MALVLIFVLWQLMGKTHQVSLHRKKELNVLELAILPLELDIILHHFSLSEPEIPQGCSQTAGPGSGDGWQCIWCLLLVAYHICDTMR